jgi:hypothetical protein
MRRFLNLKAISLFLLCLGFPLWGWPSNLGSHLPGTGNFKI